MTLKFSGVVHQTSCRLQEQGMEASPACMAAGRTLMLHCVRLAIVRRAGGHALHC